MEYAKLILRDKEYSLPVIEGTEGETAIDISQLRKDAGVITYDPGYGNTGSCQSTITFIDGDKGILHYRGYPIEELAEKSTFLEVSYLLIYGKLPNKAELDKFTHDITYHSLIHEDMKNMFEAFPPPAHPMGMLSSMIACLSAYYPETGAPGEANLNTIRLLAKLKTIAAFIYKKSIGQPFIYPKNGLSYAADILQMMYAVPAEPYYVSPVIEEALDKILILHADHEQNCSTSTVRMAGSSHANIFATIASGVSALWGPIHGGANEEVIQMLEMIQKDDCNYKKYIELAKSKTSNFRLMGFGHRVYKYFDPRARILKKACDKVLDELGIHNPLLEIAKNLERAALEEDYFIERRLYPNVDFYSGIIYNAIGLPNYMLTVFFSLGRLPGWLAQWKEMREESGQRISRPRQIYTGNVNQKYIPIEERP